MKQTKQKKRGTQTARLIFRVFFSFLLLILLGGAAAGFYLYSELQPAQSAENAQTKTITIPPGTSVRSIGEILHNEGIIKNAALFAYYTKWEGKSNQLKAGEYQLSGGQPLDEVVRTLVNGNATSEALRFTIPEGYNVKQIAERLASKGLVDKETFLKEVNEGNFSEFPFVSSIPANNGRQYRLEGYLFPETYEVRKGATEHEIIAKMLSQFEKETAELAAQLQARNMSLDDAVILASIVEREVVVDEERPIVAGVFMNRIRDNWMLQSCATVQFVLGKQRDRITFEDLKINNPYNTYINPGLPPGPIASPGRTSLQAVALPAEHEYFFFVTKKDGSSEHLFARTFAEHQKNDAKSRGNW
ncbi:endolytic transglycosylase MltG [Brevibacillus dissolubilis]|uniref:endolytic transglycosylase MltG n=1 Tax=Brevibacillus dissolubilis TaxID=1844116 RepID=UPI001116FAE9|nr:endolytic transglycosylase MltG [Brevibacillus dissolubilis]